VKINQKEKKMGNRMPRNKKKVIKKVKEEKSFVELCKGWAADILRINELLKKDNPKLAFKLKDNYYDESGELKWKEVIDDAETETLRYSIVDNCEINKKWRKECLGEE